LVTQSGTTTTGGGNSGSGEIQITYKSGAPSAPSNVAITDAQTEGELTVDWDAVSDATGYYVYRAESSGSAKADYTQVADVSSPPYTDTALEDGERYYYRVSAYN
jgi:fibronectin type 3 domain-containing protein